MSDYVCCTPKKKGVIYGNHCHSFYLRFRCLLKMVETGLLPAASRDLKNYLDSGLGGRRKEIYARVEVMATSLVSNDRLSSCVMRCLSWGVCARFFFVV